MVLPGFYKRSSVASAVEQRGTALTKHLTSAALVAASHWLRANTAEALA